jgi:hypothetical protein
MRQYLLSVGCLFSLSITQARAAENCTDVIRLSRTVIHDIFDKESLEQFVDNFCNESSKTTSSGSSVEADASWKLLAGHLAKNDSSREEIAARYCGGSNGSSRRKDAFEHYVSSVAGPAYTAYMACIGDNKEIGFDDPAIKPKEFSLDVTFKPSGESVPAKMSYSLSSGITCNWERRGRDNEIDLAPLSTVTLHCVRVQQNEEGYVIVRRDNGTRDAIQIPWGKYSNDGHLQDDIGTITDQLVQLRSNIQEVKGKLGSDESMQASMITFARRDRACSHPDNEFDDKATIVVQGGDRLQSAGAPANTSLVPSASDPITWKYRDITICVPK